MERPTDAEGLSFDGVISTLARQRSRMVNVEYDDLVQEARLQAWGMLLKGEIPTEKDFVNCMRRYMRAQREGRGIVYEALQ